MRIAILEDDVHVGQLFTTGEAFRKSLGRESYDLLILDRTLPDIQAVAKLLAGPVKRMWAAVHG